MQAIIVQLMSLSAWLGASAGPPSSEWIWFPEGDPLKDAPAAVRHFRKIVKIAPAPKTVAAWACIAVDNAYELYVNGARIGAGKAWDQPDTYDLTAAIKPGDNAIAVMATNAGGPAGLLCTLAIVAEDGSVQYVRSDGSWRTSDKAPDGWTGQGFDDASWRPVKVLGRAPLAPWSAVTLPGSLLDVSVGPEVVSPNGDDVNDEAEIQVRYALGKAGGIELKIVDAQRKEIAAFSSKGKTDETFVWNAVDKAGKAVPNGAYTCMVTAKSGTHSTSVEKPVTVKAGLAFKKPPNTMQTIFPVGVWYDGRVEGINCPEGFVDVPRDMAKARLYYEKTFKDIKDHGLDIVVIPNTPPEYRETLLAVADGVGVKIVLELAEIAWPEFGGDLAIGNPKMIRDETVLLERLKALTAPLQKHPSLMAYQLIDEPPASLFENWRLINRVLGHIDPGRPAFSCLCREDELHRTSRMGTQMIVFDRYPIGAGSTPGSYDWQHWIGLLETLRRHADANRIPYWIVLQTCAKPGAMRFPTPAEIRVMTYLALAHNAKGVFFFLYNSMTQQERLQGLVDVNLKPVPLYETVASLAHEIKKLTPTLLTIKPTDSIASVTAKVDVKTFIDSTDRRHLFVTNLDVVRPATFTTQLELPTLKEIRDLLTGESIAVSPGGAPKKHSFSLTLAPGQGKLLLLVP